MRKEKRKQRSSSCSSSTAAARALASRSHSESTCAAVCVCVSHAHRQLVLSRERVQGRGARVWPRVCCAAAVRLLVEDTKEPAAALALSAARRAVQKTLRTTLSSCLSLSVQFYCPTNCEVAQRRSGCFPLWFVVKGGTRGTVTLRTAKKHTSTLSTHVSLQFLERFLFKVTMACFRCEVYDTHGNYVQRLCLYIPRNH